MTRRVALGGCLAGIALSSALTEVRAQEGAGGGDADFEGKFVVVYQKSHTDNSSWLENVRVRKLGDKSFLVGSGIKSEHPRLKGFAGVVHWIPIDDIALLQVFPTVESIMSLSDEPKRD